MFLKVFPRLFCRHRNHTERDIIDVDGDQNRIGNLLLVGVACIDSAFRVLTGSAFHFGRGQERTHLAGSVL